MKNPFLIIYLFKFFSILEIDLCASNPCSHGYCTNFRTSYACTCKHGFTGINCDKSESIFCVTYIFFQL